jgi:hypothetical protein
MKNKKAKKIIRLFIYGLLGVWFLGAGVLYAKFEKWGLQATIPGPLRSQIIWENPASDTPKITLSADKIATRIVQLEKEILQETNDPERALKLRRELQGLKEQQREVFQ